MTTKGGGGQTRSYRCAENVKARCNNHCSVREPLARTKILDALRARLLAKDGLSRLASASHASDGIAEQHKARLRKVDDQIARLVEFISAGTHSEAVGSKLAELEAQKRQEKATIADLPRRSKRPIVVPTLDAVLRTVTELETLLRSDVAAAREHLRRLFKDGRIVLIPDETGIYTAKCRVLPLVLLAENTDAPAGGQGVVYGFRSGGRI